MTDSVYQLTVQDFLKSFVSPKIARMQLQVKFAITVEEDYLSFKDGTTEPVWIYNYDPKKSHGEFKIENECNGLILNKDHDIVSRSFNRMFDLDDPNAAEVRWNHARMETKLDGTQVILFGYKGELFLQTLKRVGADDTLQQDSTRTYHDAVMGLLEDKLFKGETVFPNVNYDRYSWIFEYVGPDNYNVTPYDKEEIFLIGGINRVANVQISSNYLDKWAQNHGLTRPDAYKVSSAEEAKSYASNWCDCLEKGFVVVDYIGRRVNVRNNKYLDVHRLLNHVANPPARYFAKVVLSGEAEEIADYFPHYYDVLMIMDTTLNEMVEELSNIWALNHNIDSKKRFAAAVKDHPFSRVLFEAYDGRINSFEDVIALIRPEHLVKETGARHAATLKRAIDEAFKAQG